MNAEDTPLSFRGHLYRLDTYLDVFQNTSTDLPKGHRRSVPLQTLWPKSWISTQCFPSIWYAMTHSMHVSKPLYDESECLPVISHAAQEKDHLWHQIAFCAHFVSL